MFGDGELLVAEERYRECCNFLYFEAQLLDEGRLHDWLDLLTKDIDYKAPVRITREKSVGNPFSDKTFFFSETYGSLDLRITRLDSEYAWADDPPSRTRRNISNIRMEQSNKKDEYGVRSNLMLFRSRGDTVSYDLLSGERHDTLRNVQGKLKLAKRLVLLDHTILPTNDLAIFL